MCITIIRSINSKSRPDRSRNRRIPAFYTSARGYKLEKYLRRLVRAVRFDITCVDRVLTTRDGRGPSGYRFKNVESLFRRIPRHFKGCPQRRFILTRAFVSVESKTIPFPMCVVHTVHARRRSWPVRTVPRTHVFRFFLFYNDPASDRSTPRRNIRPNFDTSLVTVGWFDLVPISILNARIKFDCRLSMVIIQIEKFIIRLYKVIY